MYLSLPSNLEEATDEQLVHAIYRVTLDMDEPAAELLGTFVRRHAPDAKQEVFRGWDAADEARRRRA